MCICVCLCAWVCLCMPMCVSMHVCVCVCTHVYLFVHTELCAVLQATQACEVDCLIPLQYGTSKLILVGDPEQLPPTVISQVCNYGLPVG